MFANVSLRILLNIVEYKYTYKRHTNTPTYSKEGKTAPIWTKRGNILNTSMDVKGTFKKKLCVHTYYIYLYLHFPIYLSICVSIHTFSVHIHILPHDTVARKNNNNSWTKSAPQNHTKNNSFFQSIQPTLRR